MFCKFLMSIVAILVAGGDAFVLSQQDATAPGSTTTIPDESIEALGKVVAEFVEKNYAVGAELLVVQDGRTLYHEVYGLADQIDKTPWTKQTICNIRSMSKPVTGVAAQILIDRGQLAIDDPVSKYLASFDNDKSRDITVRQLLTHRSGLPLTILKTKIDEYPNLMAQADAIGKKGPEFEPDSKFWYSDAGSDALGAVVEKVSGQKLDEFVTAEIFQPLEMNDTFYGIDAEDSRFSRIGSLHIGTANSWVRYWKPEEKSFYPFAWGSQTIYSTPSDYAKFMAMYLDGGKAAGQRIVSEEALARIMQPTSPMKMLGSDELYPTEFRDMDAFYGQMMIVYRDKNDEKAKPSIFGHSGSDGTGAWAWPERNLIVLYFTQSRGGTTVLKMEGAIDKHLIHAGKAVVAEPVPEKFKPFVGTFVANFGAFENEEFIVKVKNGKLTLDIPSQMAYELAEPDDKGQWAFAIAPKQVQVTFDRGDNDNVHTLRLHQAGQNFEVPRKGTERAKELAKNREVSDEEMQQLVGTYRDEVAEADVEVFIKDKVLSITVPPGLELQLRPALEEGRWLVKQSPAIALTFERDDAGKVITMTRHVGEQTRVMKRNDD